jgi:hypothetical protein
MRYVACLFLLSATLAQAGDTARVRFLYPTRMTTDEMGTVWQVIVERDSAHRLLVLSAHDGEFTVRRTDVQLEGDRARRVHRVDWRPLPAGELLVVASVFDTERLVERATVPVRVIQMRP